MLTQFGAPCCVIGWTSFSHYQTVHGFVEIFNVSLDLSTIYFARFLWVFSCTSMKLRAKSCCTCQLSQTFFSIKMSSRYEIDAGW